MNVIATTNLSRHYGRRVGVDSVDLQIDEGESFGFLGPNGAGKTTTIRLLLGFLRASAGRASIFGLDCWRGSSKIKRDVGYLPGDLRLYPWMNGRNALKIVSQVCGIDRGTIDVLLGWPVSRRSVYLCESIGWLISGFFILGMGLLGHRFAAPAMPDNMRPDLSEVMLVMTNLFAVYLAVGGVAFLVSALSDRRGRAMAITFGNEHLCDCDSRWPTLILSRPKQNSPGQNWNRPVLIRRCPPNLHDPHFPTGSVATGSRKSSAKGVLGWSIWATTTS